MAWGSNTNPCTIGDPTKKVVYDDLWDKLQYVKDSVVPAAGKMLQGASTAWVGWTKDTATWTDNSMIVFTTGSVGSGGSDSPISHGHKTYEYNAAANSQIYDSAGSLTSMTIGSSTIYDALAALTDTGGNILQKDMYSDLHVPLYQKVIAATKDTYT